MRRYGPLIAVPGALAVGDPGRHHLRLTPEAVILRAGADQVGIHAWSDVERLRLDLPTTRFRLPGLVSTLVLGILTVLTADSLDLDPEDGEVSVVVAGETLRMPLSRHHVGGYWAPTVRGAQRVLAHLIRTPAQRALLAHPESVIDVAAKLARSAPVRDA